MLLHDTTASKKANAISLPPGIRSSSDLKWWYEDDRYYPCRICDTAEGMHINLDPVWDTTELALIQVLEFPPTKPFDGRDRILANLCDLKAFGAQGETWDVTIWRHYNRQRAVAARRANQRVLSETDVRAGYLYLNRILRAAKDKDCIPEPKTADDDDNSDFETPYEVNLKLTTTSAMHPHGRGMPDFSDKIHEPLRPGDVIQYSSPIFRAGDPRGLRTATVISTDPTSTGYMIRLDNTEMLPNEHMVKRIKVIEQGKQYAHDGFYRQINRFALKKRALDMDMKQPFLRQSEQVGKIVDKNIDKFRKTMKDEGLPTQFVQDFKSRRKLKADEQLELARERKHALKKSRKHVAKLGVDSHEHDVDWQNRQVISTTKRESITKSKPVITMQESSSSDSDDSLEFVSSIKKDVPIKPKKVASSDSLMDVPDGTQSASRPKRRPGEATSLTSIKPELSVPTNCSPSHPSSRKGLSTFVAAILKPDSVSSKRKCNPMVHDESDSESSMENYGLGTAVKAERERTRDVLDELVHDQGLNAQRKNRRDPDKVVTIDHEDGRILSSRRQYITAKIDKPALGLSKVTSIAERQSKTRATKLSASVQGTPEQRQKKRKHAASESRERECVDIGEQRFVAVKVGRSTHAQTEKPVLANERGVEHIHRIKHKGWYIAEEDDIEDSDDDFRSRRTPTSTKCGNYKPVVQLASCAKEKDFSSLESY